MSCLPVSWGQRPSLAPFFSSMRLSAVWPAGLNHRADGSECGPPLGDGCPPAFSKGPVFSSPALPRPWRQQCAFILGMGIVLHPCSSTAASEQSSKLPRQNKQPQVPRQKEQPQVPIKSKKRVPKLRGPVPTSYIEKLGMVANACNPRAAEAEASRSLEFAHQPA